MSGTSMLKEAVRLCCALAVVLFACVASALESQDFAALGSNADVLVDVLPLAMKSPAVPNRAVRLFDGRNDALWCCSDRRDRTDADRCCGDEYAEKNLCRAADSDLFGAIEIKLAKAAQGTEPK